MGKVAIFIDGGYLAKTLKKDFSSAHISYEKFSALLAGESKILRTYYYNCLPYKSNPPTEEQSHRYSKAQGFINSLNYLPHYCVRLGKLEYRGTTGEGEPIYVQKRVDMLLGCDLVLLSAKHSIDKAILVTGDSDFIPAVELAKNEGVEVELVYSIANPPHKALSMAADIRRALAQSDIDKIIF